MIIWQLGKLGTIHLLLRLSFRNKKDQTIHQIAYEEKIHIARIRAMCISISRKRNKKVHDRYTSIISFQNSMLVVPVIWQA